MIFFQYYIILTSVHLKYDFQLKVVHKTNVNKPPPGLLSASVLLRFQFARWCENIRKNDFQHVCLPKKENKRNAEQCQEGERREMTKC